MKDVRMSDEGLDGLDGLCRREGANADIASNIRLGTICGSERVRACRMV